ncbi:MAG: extracellular solute-binding protein [Chloroflexi bacterium]|nr:extracellular solute-binding protein [Chloroflexota bacterium]
MTNQDPRFPLQRSLVTPVSRRRFLTRSAQMGMGVAGALGLGPLLAACGVTTSPAPGASGGGAATTLKVLLANHTGFYAMVTPEFEAQANAKIEFTREAFGPMPSVLTPAFEAGGESWDVVYLWRAWVDQYEQYLTPLSEIEGYQEPDESQLRWEAIEAAKSTSGIWYGGPSNVYTYVLYCNRQTFEDAGIDIPATYDDFVAAAAALTTGGKYGYVDGWAPLYLFPKWCVWLHLNGGEFYNSDGSVNFDAPEAIAATQDMIDLLPSMPADSIESPWGIYDVEAKKVFLAGDAAMLIDYQHLWYQSRDPELSALGDDPVRVAVIPGKGGGLPASGGQSVGECFAIPKSSPKKDLALQLVNFYASAATQLGLLTRRDELHDFDPADESGFPSFNSPYEDGSIPGDDSEIVTVTFDQAQPEIKNNRYGTRAGYQRISEIVEAAVSAALHGGDVADLHATAQGEIDQFLADNPGM